MIRTVNGEEVPLSPEQQAALDAQWTADALPPVDLRDQAKARRWEKEVGGAIWNGWPVYSDRESRAVMDQEVMAIALGTRLDGEAWKFADGVFRPLTNDQIKAMAIAVRAFVKSCFAKEAELIAAIQAGTVTTAADIDAAFATL